MSRKGNTTALKIILAFAALFTIPILLFVGQVRWTLVVLAIAAVVVVAGLWSRSRSPAE